jgi:hypothetical protein
MYCLGCCWPYFLLMVALGWMDILWMALFAGIIFGEKMWSRGIWVARAAGVGLAIAGVAIASGLVDISSHDGMVMGNQEPMNDVPQADTKNDPPEMVNGQDGNGLPEDNMSDKSMSGMESQVVKH